MNIDITTTTGKKVQVSPDNFWTAVYQQVKQQYESNKREIYLEADGHKEFVIVPTNFKKL